MDDFRVREATPDDLVRVGEIRTVGWQTAYRGIVDDAVLDELDAARETERWRGFMAGFEANGEHLDVVESETAVVGYVLIGPAHDGSGIGEVYACYVHPDAWGTGAADLLLPRAEAELAGRDYGEATLTTFAANHRARRFYERHGWRLYGRPFDHGGAPAVAYRKTLRGPG